MSVAGAFRKGKSFLLNFFLEYLYILQYSQKEFHRANNDLEWLHDETLLEGFHWRYFMNCCCGYDVEILGLERSVIQLEFGFGENQS
jgi:hypothetical protein